jgi:hypothetical protein
MSTPRKFTCTIYCRNCRTVGDYEFRRGTVLHPDSWSTWAEQRNFVPGGERTHVIRKNRRDSAAPCVACQFCGCDTAMILRERDGSAPTHVASTPETTQAAGTPENVE